MPFYTVTGNPLNQTRGLAQVVRAEFVLIAAGFAMLPVPAAIYGASSNYGVDSGVADAYVVSIAATYLTSYTDGMTLTVKTANANTGAATINVNALGLKSLTRPDGTALQAGDIAAGQVFGIVYNSTTGKFQMLQAYGGPAGPTGTLAGNASAGINWLKGPDIASATTLNPWTGSQGNLMVVTGTTATTGLSAAPQAGSSRVLVAGGAWPLTHGANFILPGSVSYTCTAGDVVIVYAITTTQFRVSIYKQDGTAVVTNGAPGLVCLAVQSPVAVAQVDFTTFIDSVYEEYEFHFMNVVPATAGTALYMRTSTNGGSSFDAGAGDYIWATMNHNTTAPSPAGSTSGGATPQIILVTTAMTVSNAASDGGISGVVKLFYPSNTTTNKQVSSQLVAGGASGLMGYFVNTGQRLSTADVDAVRFLFSSGNIASGQFKLYGVRRSV